MAPSDDRLDGEECLSFELAGPWAHFRRVEGNVVKQTYRVIPRTTAAGLVAAILGLPRDSYYDLFSPETSAIAIEPQTDLRTMNMPMNTLSTTDSSMTTVPSRGEVKITLPDPTKPRQQHNYEVLVEPRYRLDLWLEDDRQYEALKERLESGEAYYVPSLGLSEHLAEIEYLGEHTMRRRDGERVEIDSTAPDLVDSVIPEPDVRCHTERPPAYMERADQGRRTTAFISQAYCPDGADGTRLTVRDTTYHDVDGRSVIFT